jgi:hypothetical protein
MKKKYILRLEEFVKLIKEDNKENPAVGAWYSVPSNTRHFMNLLSASNSEYRVMRDQMENETIVESLNQMIVFSQYLGFPNPIKMEDFFDKNIDIWGEWCKPSCFINAMLEGGNYIRKHGLGVPTQLTRSMIIFQWNRVAKNLKQKYLKED